MKSTVTQKNTHRRTSAKRGEPNRSALALGIRAMLVAGGLLGAPAAWANCASANLIITCDTTPPNPYTNALGTVIGGAHTIIVQQGAIVDTGQVLETAMTLYGDEVVAITVVIDGE